MEISIKWDSLIQVFVASLSFTVLIVAAFAVGVRLLTNAQNAVPGARKGKTKDIQKEVVNRVFSYMAFSVCIAALLFGIYLVDPALPKPWVK
ncbi:MAG: hypothetical protein RL719_193 [Actinomycetota bacterium]|jgi:hypothetical protein